MDPNQLQEAKTASEDMDAETGDAQGMDTPDMGGMEDCVPIGALAMPDDGEQMQEPKVGDKVSYQVEGEVSRIEGDNAYVNKTAVNGQKVEAPAKPADELGDLESQAKGMSDTEGGY